MAYYQYYQSAAPNWGSQGMNQHFIAPPVPSYQPQPSWTGQDYYRAHYGLSHNGLMEDSDIGMFDWVWDRVKGFVSGGVGREEARHWHRRVYGGMVDITSLLASDLGAAAGYEALRLFDYHKSIYRQPLMDDHEREEEALAGLATAEATKLWSYCQRPADKYGLRETCEVAAATAERLFRRSRRGSYDDYGSSSRRIRSSSRTRGGYDDYSSDEYSDDYEHDRRSRRNRRRSSGNYGRRSSIGMAGYAGSAVPTYGGVPLPIQAGYPGSVGAAPYAPQAVYPPQAGYGASQPGYGASQAGYSAYQPTYPTNNMGSGVGGFAYAPTTATPQLSTQLVIPQSRPRAGSFSYGTSQYGGY